MVQYVPPAQAQAQQQQYRQWLASLGRLMQYQVEIVRQTLIGDKVNTSELQGMLNRYATDGWSVKSITATSVHGRVGPGGTDGLIIVFERPIPA